MIAKRTLSTVLMLTVGLFPLAVAAATEAGNGDAEIFSAHALALPEGEPASWVPGDLARLYRVVEDEDAEDGRALQVFADTRVLQQQDIPVLRLPRRVRPVGVYRISARIKMSGMLNVIGTAIRFDRGAPAALREVPSNHRDWMRYWEPTLHGYHFREEDVYHEFSFLAEVIEPDAWTLRPYRPREMRAGYTRLESKAEHERWRAIWAEGGSVAQVDFERKQAERAAERERLAAQPFEGGPLTAEITLLQTVNKGFGRSHNSLRTLTVDWIRVEPVSEPGHAVVRQVLPQKVWLRPGDGQVFHVWMHNRSGRAVESTLRLFVEHGIDARIAVGEQTVVMEDGAYRIVEVPWRAPAEDLWGCEVVAELAEGGRVLSEARDVFSLHFNPWAVMNFGGTSRNRNPLHSPPGYKNWMEMFGISYRDGIAPFPPEPDLPYISGMTGPATQTTLDMQRRAVEHNHRIGIASFLYIQPMCATGPTAAETYVKHPEWFRGPLIWSDRWHDRWEEAEADMLRRWLAGEEPERYTGLLHIEAGLNHAVDEVFYAMLDGTILALEHVGWDGVRWDGAFECHTSTYLGKTYGTGSVEGDAEMSAERSRILKREVRKRFPHYTESANIGTPTAVYTRNVPADPPQTSRFHAAFLADGSSVMNEGWMSSHFWHDPRSIIRDYFWGARQSVDWCRQLGGFFYGFCPDRDATPYFTQSIIYYNLLMPLAGAHNNYAPHTCTPYSETGEAHFVTRFSEFLFDLELKPLEQALTRIRVDSPVELWYDEQVVWRDLPDGRRRYVIPLVNPPTIERFLRDRFSELPEPLREPFRVEVEMPAGFDGARAWMLTAEPRTDIVPLDVETGGGLAVFEVPELMIYRVLVVEFDAGVEEEGQ